MSSLKLVLLGFLRHIITALGMWLVAKGYLTQEQHDAWISTAVQEAFGACLIVGSQLWSAFDKTLVINWIRQALHMPAPGPSPASEKHVAKKISKLITSPGTTAAPTVGLFLCALLVVPLLSCGSGGGIHIPIGGGSTDPTTTVYRDPERARTVLIALETLRFHSAETVAKACIQGRLQRTQCNQYQTFDDDFRTAWATASDLVRLWLNTKAAPAQMEASMAAVESRAAKIEIEARKVQ